MHLLPKRAALIRPRLHLNCPRTREHTTTLINPRGFTAIRSPLGVVLIEHPFANSAESLSHLILHDQPVFANISGTDTFRGMSLRRAHRKGWKEWRKHIFTTCAVGDFAAVEQPIKAWSTK